MTRSSLSASRSRPRIGKSRRDWLAVHADIAIAASLIRYRASSNDQAEFFRHACRARFVVNLSPLSLSLSFLTSGDTGKCSTAFKNSSRCQRSRGDSRLRAPRFTSRATRAPRRPLFRLLNRKDSLVGTNACNRTRFQDSWCGILGMNSTVSSFAT